MANTDIDPPEAFIAAHPALAFLLDTPAISTQFAAHEQIAAPAKRRYTALGVFSLVAAFLTLSALIFTLTLNRELENTAFTILMGALGVIGIAAQWTLLFGPFKRRWLQARFAAERMRCIKFQAFAALGASLGARASAAQAFVQRGLAHLALELSAGRAALHEFNPETSLGEISAETTALSLAELQELKGVYRELRLDYQIKHATGKIREINEERRMPAAGSELAFWGGAAIGYLDLVLAFEPLQRYGAGWESVRHFLALFLFVSAAILFVLERGRSHNAALERYEDYRSELTRIAGALERAQTAADFVDCVRQAERTAMRELKAFCRESDKSTYLF